ncbi:MAG: 3-oxoadipate enol-lactonase 2 [Candidatus Heimdallarchaeota archaeon LC_3]|nr:MAG: 3-oxoadipate enol-lactonase 2 [Candidatus Heimdallarchaeota archaeon LC_3]
MPYIKTIRIYYEIHGPDEAPPLVLIEGIWQDSWMWFRQIPDFSKKYRCIVFDNRGIGRTSKPDSPYSIKMMVDDILALLNELNVPKAHILGVSFGGFIAQQFAISYPEKTISLIIATSHFGGKNYIQMEKKDLALMVASQTETISKEQALEMRLSVGHSEEFLKSNRKLINQTLIWREQHQAPDYSRLHQFRAALDVDLENDLHKITSQTLIIQGTKDKLVPPENAKLLNQKISNSEIFYIEGGPHWISIENFEEFNQAILEFLNKQ